LVAPQLPETTFQNVPVTLTGEDFAELPHQNLVEGSVTVKWLAAESPVRESNVVMNSYDETSLAHTLIVPASLVTAFDESLQTVFAEEKDYRVNETQGKIARVPGTSISNAIPVVVWYDYFTAFDEGDDYFLNTGKGTVTRASGSAIPDGATVLVDYTVAEGNADDQLIDAAILEAEDMIVRCLREGYNESSLDYGLHSGATYLALSIVARGMAALTLTRNRGTDAASRAKEWQSLSDNWWKLAWDTLAPFTLPHSIRTPLAQ
jgi:hypothetical protein